jgi:hypothetical protein
LDQQPGQDRPSETKMTEDKHKPPLPKVHHAPATPGKPRVHFKFVEVITTKGKEKFKVTGIVTPSAAVSSDQDTDIQITVTLNGTALPMLDAGPPPGITVSFPCNAGDTGTVTQVDVNVVGDSPASAPLLFTVPTLPPPPPTAVPQTPGVPTITFTNP